MQVVVVNQQEIPVADILEAIEDHLQRQGETYMAQAQMAEGQERGCCQDYAVAVLRLKADLHRAAERFDGTVSDHLNGPCTAH